MSCIYCFNYLCMYKNVCERKKIRFMTSAKPQKGKVNLNANLELILTKVTYPKNINREVGYPLSSTWNTVLMGHPGQ